MHLLDQILTPTKLRMLATRNRNTEMLNVFNNFSRGQKANFQRDQSNALAVKPIPQGLSVMQINKGLHVKCQLP